MLPGRRRHTCPQPGAMGVPSTCIIQLINKRTGQALLLGLGMHRERGAHFAVLVQVARGHWLSHSSETNAAGEKPEWGSSRGRGEKAGRLGGGHAGGARGQGEGMARGSAPCPAALPSLPPPPPAFSGASHPLCHPRKPLHPRPTPCPLPSFSRPGPWAWEHHWGMRRSRQPRASSHNVLQRWRPCGGLAGTPLTCLHLDGSGQGLRALRANAVCACPGQRDKVTSALACTPQQSQVNRGRAPARQVN